MGTWNGVTLDDLVLTSQRLTLRPWQPSDAMDVHRIMGDPAMHAHLNLPMPYRRSDAVSYVSDFCPRARAEGTALECAVTDTARGTLVGAIALRGLAGSPSDTSVELGYWIDPAEQGRGRATEAVRAVTDFALARGGQRCVIRAAIGNLASVRVAMKAGYRFEAVERHGMRTGTGPTDTALLSRLPTDDGSPVPPVWDLPPGLGDGVVSLRVTGPEDWPTVLAENTNDEARRWSPFEAVMTEGEARRRAGQAGLDALVSRLVDLVIVDAATGTAAGTLQLRRQGLPGLVNLGYGVLPAYRGRGFAGRAVAVVTEWLLGAGGMHRVQLGANVANHASIRVAQKAGFEQVAVLPDQFVQRDGTLAAEAVFGRSRS